MNSAQAKMIDCYFLSTKIRTCASALDGVNTAEHEQAMKRILEAFKSERGVIAGLDDDLLYATPDDDGIDPVEFEQEDVEGPL